MAPPPKLGTRWPVNQELYNTLARAQGDMHTRVIVPKPWYTSLQWGPYVKLRLKLVSPLKL